jgi:MFS family permease
MQITYEEVGRAQADGALFRKITLRVMPFLLACYLFAYLDRVNVAFAKLQMAQQLQFSEAVYGLGAGIFFIGYFLFEVPSNLIMARVGARRWISRIMITWGLLSAGMMFVTTANQFYVMRFLLGVAEAGFFPGVLLYLSQWFPSVQRGRVVALLMAAVPVSSVIGAPLSGMLLDTMQGVGGMGGWQWLFLVEGVPSLLLGVLCLFVLTDKVADAAWLSPQEKNQVLMQFELENKHKTTHSFAAALASPRLWLLAFIYFCIALGNLGLAFWMPTLVREAGVQSLGNIGWLIAIPYLSATFVMIRVGRSADQRRERRYHLAVPMLIGAAGLIAAAHMPNVALTLAALVVATAGLTTALPMFWPLPSAMLGGTAMAGGLALLNSAGALAGFVGPFGIGWLKTNTGHPILALYAMAAIVAAGAAAVLTLRAKEVNR